MQPTHIKLLISFALLVYAGRTDAQIQKSDNVYGKVTDTVKTTQKLLKTVTVSTAKPFITQTADKIILNVAQSPLAAGSNVYEILLRAPGLMETGSALQFRTKNVLVLVDGKYTNLSGDNLKSLLSAMPAHTVEKIEILPQPPARYDAQGGTVINIHSVRNKNYGTNGTWVAGIGTGRYVRGNSGISLNYRDKKLNLYGSYDYQYNAQYYDNHSNRLLNTGTSIHTAEHDIRKRNNQAAKWGLDYDINRKNTVGILVKAMNNTRGRAVTNRSVANNVTSAADSFSTVATAGHALFRNASVNMYYRHVFDTAGKEIAFNADYFGYRKTWNDELITRYYDENGLPYADPFLLKDHSPASNHVRSLSADYVHPLRTVKIEAGIKTTFTTTDNDVVWKQQQKGGEWINDAGKTNHFIYKENINAAYVSAGKTIKKFSVQLGLRAEQTNTSGLSITLNEKNTNSYSNLFPHAALQYKQSAKQQFGFSYRKSINRFGFDRVNPFVVYQSQYAYYKGNPGLLPSVLHSFGGTHTYKNQWFTSISYVHYNNMVAEVFFKDVNSGAIITTTGNIKRAAYADGSVTFTKTFFNIWNTSTTAGAYYAKYYTASEAGLHNSRATAYVSTDNTLLLSKGFKMQLHAYYFSPTAWGVYQYKSRYAVHGGISKNVLHNNGTLTMNVTDIFNTQTGRYAVNSFGVISTNVDKAESRYVKFAFTWRFGNTNVKGAKNRKTGIDDEKNRMNAVN